MLPTVGADASCEPAVCQHVHVRTPCAALKPQLCSHTSAFARTAKPKRAAKSTARILLEGAVVEQNLRWLEVVSKVQPASAR